MDYDECGWGVVSPLQETDQLTIDALRAHLAPILAASGSAGLRIPHVTHCAARDYDAPTVHAALCTIADDTEPFRIRTAGWAVFTGPTPILSLMVVRAPALVSLHQLLWQRLNLATLYPIAHYEPDFWIPHITLGEMSIDDARASDVIRWLNQQDLAGEMIVDRVGVASGTAGDAGLASIHTLRVRPP